MKYILLAFASTVSALMINADIKVKQDCQYEDLNGNDHCVLMQGYSLEGPGACTPIPWDGVFNAKCNGWSLVQRSKSGAVKLAQEVPAASTKNSTTTCEFKGRDGLCKEKPAEIIVDSSGEESLER